MPIDEFPAYLATLAAAATHQQSLEAQKRQAEIEHAEKLAEIKVKDREQEQLLLKKRQATAEKELAAHTAAQAVLHQQHLTADSQCKAEEAAALREKEAAIAAEQARQLAQEQHRLASENALVLTKTAEETERKLKAARELRLENERLAALRDEERAKEERLLEKQIKAAEAKKASEDLLRAQEEAERAEAERQRIENQRSLKEVEERIAKENLERLTAWIVHPERGAFETSEEYAARLSSYGNCHVGLFRFREADFNLEEERFFIRPHSIAWIDAVPKEQRSAFGFYLAAARDQAVKAYQQGNEIKLVASIEPKGKTYRFENFSLLDPHGDVLGLVNLETQEVIPELREIVERMIMVEPGVLEFDNHYGEKRLQYLKIEKPFYLSPVLVSESEKERFYYYFNEYDDKRWNLRQSKAAGWFTYHEAELFCQRLTALCRKYEVALPCGFEFGLPDAFQWEYACRAGSLGNGALMLTGKEEHRDSCYWDIRSSPDKTPDVDSPPPNMWGFRGMQCFTAQWCHSPNGASSRYRRDCLSGVYGDSTEMREKRLCTSGFNGRFEAPLSMSDCNPNQHQVGLRLALVSGRK